MTKFETLKVGIMKLSKSQVWESAKVEWGLDYIDFLTWPDQCLCGHYPILNACYISNSVTNKTALVGNCCVKKFLNMPSDKIFKSYEKLKASGDSAMNNELAQLAHRNKWITDWEYSFSLDTFRKRNLTSKQWQARVKINTKVLTAMEDKHEQVQRDVPSNR